MPCTLRTTSAAQCVASSTRYRGYSATPAGPSTRSAVVGKTPSCDRSAGPEQRHSVAPCAAANRYGDGVANLWIAPLSIAPGGSAILGIAWLGASEACIAQSNAVATLGAALAFLLYFAGSLSGAVLPWVSRVAVVLRPAQDQLLRGCALATALQLGLAGYLCARYPAHGEGALVPLYAAGYLSVAILAATQDSRRLKGRKRFELEAGEGERHSVMAQGARLAARNYAALILTTHLAAQAGAGALAAATAAAAGAGVSLLPWPLAVAYGVVAVLFGVACACRFVPGMQRGSVE